MTQRYQKQIEELLLEVEWMTLELAFNDEVRNNKPLLQEFRHGMKLASNRIKQLRSMQPCHTTRQAERSKKPNLKGTIWEHHDNPCVCGHYQYSHLGNIVINDKGLAVVQGEPCKECVCSNFRETKQGTLFSDET